MTNTITTKEFAAHLGTDPRTLRKFLRNITPKADQPGKGSRWELAGTKTAIAKARKQFAAWQEEEAKRNAERAAKVAAELAAKVEANAAIEEDSDEDAELADDPSDEDIAELDEELIED